MDDKTIEQKYESLKKSVNNAIKLLCDKIENMKSEIKDLREEKFKNQKASIACKCKCEKKISYLKGNAETLSTSMNSLELRLNKLEDITPEENTGTIESSIKDINDKIIDDIDNKLITLDNHQTNLS